MKDHNILLTYFVAAAIGLGGIGFSSGVLYGARHEKRSQVADYNDGWTDGQQDLMQQQWDAHYSGKGCAK